MINNKQQASISICTTVDIRGNNFFSMVKNLLLWFDEIAYINASYVDIHKKQNRTVFRF